MTGHLKNRDLFGSDIYNPHRLNDRVSKTYFVSNLTNINEARFYSVVERMQVDLIIDCRSFPTFKWPHFNHNRLFDRLNAIEVNYFSISEHINELRMYSHFRSRANLLFHKSIDSVWVLGNVESELTQIAIRSLSKRNFIRSLPPK